MLNLADAAATAGSARLGVEPELADEGNGFRIEQVVPFQMARKQA